MICNGNFLKLCELKDCTKCFEKSFASNNKSQFWHYKKNKNINPRQLPKNSGKKFWFICDKCHHDFNSSLGNINSRLSWCPYCKNKKLCDNLSCNHCYENSFESHPKSKYWHKTKNQNSPRQISINSGKKAWFSCNKCTHDFILKYLI